MSVIKFLARFSVWLAAWLLRFVFMVLGVVFVPFSLVGDGARRTPKMWRWFGQAADVPDSHNTSRWRKYVWMAWRNPLEGLDSTLKQPVPEKMPNPDETVRMLKKPFDSRYMEHGIFWEYWSLRAMKNKKYWEFRIGWKFVDGNEDFVPTLQLGPKR